MKHTYTSYYLDCPLVKGRVFDVFEPKTITKDAALFIVHGGGWRAGSRESFHEIMQAFNDRGYIVASTDYRLYAKDAFEQISDIRQAYDRFVTLLKEKKRPLKIAVYGESAGAHLASMVICTQPDSDTALENEWIVPAMGILQATPYDFLPREYMMSQTWAMFTSIAGVPYETHPEIYERLSLKNHINESNPPLFFMEAEYENMFPSDLTHELYEKHLLWGIPSQWKVYEKMEHGFFYELRRQAQLEAFEDICEFMDNR
ncbi:MAG: alpha/beta hydrolase [Ruminococcaceae bacterium]|nr:alpha/beta hydrolase [Oscillospiraceae bacterium]